MSLDVEKQPVEEPVQESIIKLMEVLFINGKMYTSYQEKKKRLFAKEVQIIFQDPYASLNPRMTVGDIIAEGIDIHGLIAQILMKEQKG